MARDAKRQGTAKLEGEDLKTALKRLSKGPMKFAFGFEKRQEPVLLVHKTKSPQLLRKELKDQHGAKKTTHGTASADGKALVLDVEGVPIPGMDKMVKLLLRKEKVGKYTEARVRLVAGVAPGGDGGGADEAGLAELRALRGTIEAKEPEALEHLRGLASGAGGDTGVLAAYAKLCAGFAMQARDCTDPDLQAFAKSCAERAKKVAAVLKSAGGSAPAPAAASKLSGSVGKGGANQAPDVTLVQQLLNGHGAGLTVDGRSGPATVKAIAVFQKDRLGFMDGRVDPGGKTWSALNGDAVSASPAAGGGATNGAVPGAGAGAAGSTAAPGGTGAGAGGAGEPLVSATAQRPPAQGGTPPPDGGGVPDGAGVEVGWGDDAISVKKGADGTTVTIKHDQDLPLLARNFTVWVIPCYTKGGLKASIEGSATIGKKTGGALTATGAGSLELGVGGTSSEITAGPYGSIQLSASNSCSLTYDEQDGLDIQPFTFTIKGSGKVGVKVEVNDGPKVDVEQEVFDWELFVVHVGRYVNDKFEYVKVQAGKDMLRLIAALEAGGPKIEAFVEEHAPEALKQAAVDAAEWAAESDTAGEVADLVDEQLKKVQDKTGVDVGAGIEELVQSLVDENGETAAEATERVNQEMATFDASTEDFHAVMDASGLNGDLRPYRTSQEYNAIVDVWQAETELVVKGKSAPGKWRGMVETLVSTAKKRRAQQQAVKQQAKQEENEAVRAAVAAMEGARPAAQGPGNVLNNKLSKTPNAEAKKHFDKGWQHWAAAEATRKEVASLKGPQAANRASQAKALYEQARSEFQTGLQYL